MYYVYNTFVHIFCYICTILIASEALILYLEK